MDKQTLKRLRVVIERTNNEERQERQRRLAAEHCWFCLKSRREVRLLVQTAEFPYPCICNECHTLLNDLMARPTSVPVPPEPDWPEPQPKPDPPPPKPASSG